MGQVFAFGTITVVFMCLERSKRGMGLLAESVENWDPSNLPALHLEHARHAKATSRSVAIAEIVASVVVGIVFLTAMWGPAQIQLDRLTIKPAPI